jgi:iron complex transport system permease protein
VLSLLLAGLRLGSVNLSNADWWQGFSSFDNSYTSVLIWQLRLPRLLSAVLAGAALAVAGLCLQTFFRNPLAGPGILGISSGATLGVAVLHFGIFGAGTALLILGGRLIAALAGAAAVLLLLLWLSVRFSDMVSLLIAGIMLGNLVLAVVSIWQYFSRTDQLRNFMLWTMGEVVALPYLQLLLLLLLIVAAVALLFADKLALNAWLLGEQHASALGVSTRTIRLKLLLATGVLTAVTTAWFGPIAFIGLAVPHLVRQWLKTGDHRWLLPGSALLGAILLLTCDLIAQWPGKAATLPLNAITSLFGSPVVLWLVLRQRKLSTGF